MGAVERRAGGSASRSLRTSRAERSALVGRAQLEAVGYIGSRALEAQAMVSMVERSMREAEPDAAAALEYLSHKATNGLGEVVDRAVGRIARS